MPNCVMRLSTAHFTRASAELRRVACRTLARPQPSSEQLLEPEHRILRDTLTWVPTARPPRRASLCFNLLQDTIVGGTPSGRICSVAQSGHTLGHEGWRGLTPEHSLITGPRVVGPIARHLVDGIANLVEQSGQRLTVADATLGEFHCDNLFHALINPQVQLAPQAPAVDTMPPHTPFSRAIDPQPGHINDDIEGHSEEEQTRELETLLAGD
jgi:hypothetical protein